MGQLASEWMRLAMTHAWQVTALIVLTAVAVRLFARNRPHLAFVLWLLVLVKCVTPPVWSSPSGVFSWLHPPQSVAATESQLHRGDADCERHNGAEAAVTATFVASPRSTDSARGPTPRPRNLDSGALVAADSARRSSAIGRVTSSDRGIVALLVIWAFGAVLIAVVSVLRCLGYCWRVKRQGCVEEPRIADLVRDLSRRLRVKRRVRLLLTTSRTGPAVIGVLRPTVLLPTVLVEGKSDEDLKPLLAHELIHVRRGDLWTGMLQVIAQALWWCHPLVWWAGRRASREAERCCDEEVIGELGCSSARYARSLLDVLELKKTLKPVPAFPGVRPVEITSNRLERIMKLGQGCHRRTPWWCWLVLLISAALMLPGAAFLAGEKDEPVKCLTSPQNLSVAPIPALPKTFPDQPLETRVYAVADLIDKVQLEQETDIETAKDVVIGHIRVSTSMSSHERETPDLQSKETTDGSEGAGKESSKQNKRPRVEWSENKLIVRHTADWHKRIYRMLEVLRKYGFGQVVIETRLVTGPADAVNAIGSNWTIVGTEVETDEQPTHQDPTEPLRAYRQHVDPHKVPDRPLPESSPRRRTRAHTIVEKRLPVMIEVMDDRHVSKVLGQLQNNPKVSVLANPKVALLNGQSGVIKSCSQRPFVVGLKDGAPQIRIVDEGLSMQLRPIRRGNATVWLDYALTLASIRDVETTTIPGSKSGTGTTLQVPVVAKTQLETSVEVPSGKTLVLGGFKTTDGKGKEQSMLVMLRATGLPLQVDSDDGDTPSDRQVFGVGVDSDAGVTGEIVLDSENFAADSSPEAKAAEKPPSPSLPLRPVVEAHSCKGIEPPTDDDVIRALDEKRNLNGALSQAFEKHRDVFRIVKKKKADDVNPPISYPLIGWAQRHRTQYECSVYFTESSEVEWPIACKSDRDVAEVVYVETTHLHKLDENQPDLEPHEAPSRKPLEQRIEVNLDRAPLSAALSDIAERAGLIVVIDKAGIHEEGVTKYEPVTVNLSSPVSVESALKLILEPLHLDYVIDGETITITSESRNAGKLFTRSYGVADLVIPVPAHIHAPGAGSRGKPAKRVEADFETLIDLITNTVVPSTWDDVGGHGSIAEFPKTLSLVVSQTEDVHEHIADLLAQLRRLQDVQVTVSLKTIRVRDEYASKLAGTELMGDSTSMVDSVSDFLGAPGAEGQREIMMLGPKMTLFNGQKASLRLRRPESERMGGVGAFHLQTVVSDDRRSVRLTFAAEPRESGDIVPDGTTKVVPVGESLVVDITDDDAKADSGERLLMILTPEVIVNEE